MLRRHDIGWSLLPQLGPLRICWTRNSFWWRRRVGRGGGWWTLCEEGESLAKCFWKQWYGFLALGSPATSTSRRALSKMSCQDVSRFGKLARNLFQIHANFLNLQESFLSCKILVPNPCKNLVLLNLLPDSCKIQLEKILPRFFSRSC